MPTHTTLGLHTTSVSGRLLLPTPSHNDCHIVASVPCFRAAAPPAQGPPLQRHALRPPQLERDFGDPVLKPCVFETMNLADGPGNAPEQRQVLRASERCACGRVAVADSVGGTGERHMEDGRAPVFVYSILTWYRYL